MFNPLGMAWEVTVTVEYADSGPPFAPQPAPVRIGGTGPGWYRGDLHVHSVHSDGTRQPSEVVGAARESGLDFFVSTEHNTNSANHIWGRHVPDDLLVVAGEEVTTRHGHWLAIGIPAEQWVDWRYGPADSGAFARCAASVHEAGGLVAAAHPAIPLPGTGWEFGFEHVDAIEVWNGPWSAEDEAALGLWHTRLLAGRRITAIGNSDSHRPEQPLGLPQTVVDAEELSVPALVAALRAGRAYLAASSAVMLEVAATSGGVTARIGGTLPVGRGEEVTLTARVAGAAGATLVLHTALGPAAATQTSGDGTGTLSWRGWGRACRFLRVEVRAAASARMIALSNPIWLVAPT
ncbi:CehA/McbA family metallohydrolase [Prauserella oleivorans]